MPVQRDEQHYEKRVDYVAKDEDAQTATGVVMVPWTVDHHGDWERPETIEAFAAQFDAFIDAEQADGGILHSVWPSDWMTLERNEVLAEAEEIGGETVPEGAWVQSWGYHDDELWGLVEDDILGGHSIGAVSVDWSFSGEDPEDLPDEVDVPDEVDAVEYYELTDGIIQEVSAVDFPAVPDAQILTASKARAAAAEKRFAEHVGNPNGFIEEALERGHSEEAAQRMWDVVDRAINVDGAGEPGAKSKGRLTRAATTVLSALTGSDDGSTSEPPDASTAKDATGGETPDDGGTAAADDMSNKDDEPPSGHRPSSNRPKRTASASTRSRTPTTTAIRWMTPPSGPARSSSRPRRTPSASTRSRSRPGQPSPSSSAAPKRRRRRWRHQRTPGVLHPRQQAQ
ncbi:XkdF-like putative serine protease domain-containing protein [Halomicroarcula sp. GCM10025709]|uniref:XkdF-like putative serine protease domain-containing protein n=1 Tax=Halomicroarcula sp. GCM10025709 TaxID=3252669 RepID=UPI00360AC80E